MPRKESSFFEDLMTVTAKMPPWVGLSLASISYFLCHQLSLVEPGQDFAMEDLSKIIWLSAIRIFGMFGQFLFPIVFFFGALGSFIRRYRGRRLVKRISAHHTQIEEISWREFELLVTTLLRDSGFSVVDNLSAGADGGIDQTLRKDGKKYLVQCKHWRAQKVGVSVVREMFGLMVAEGADEVWVVTSGRFTEEAMRFADGKPIQLVDGKQLGVFAAAESVAEPSLQYVAKPASPSCPKCSAIMVKRTAKKGRNVGSEFWGCPTYPKCNGTISCES